MAARGFLVTGLFELERNLNALARASAKAEARAVNRVSTTIVANQSRAVRERVNLRAARIKEAVKILAPATEANPRIVIQVQRRPVGLVEFGGRWNGRRSRGASALVLRGSGRHTLEGTFIAVGLRGRASTPGNRQIFERTGKFAVARLGRYAGERREKLHAFYGPSVFSQFKRPDIQAEGIRTWNERLPIELKRELAFALRKVGG